MANKKKVDSDYDFFLNTKQLPLDELTISCPKIAPNPDVRNDSAHNLVVYPALHARFIQDINFAIYHKYDPDIEKEEPNINPYLICGKHFHADLCFLASRNYHQFWCYITKSESCIRMIKSFLIGHTPVDALDAMHAKCRQTHTEILEKHAELLNRAFTLKVSDAEYMSEKVVVMLLRTNGLLSFPIVLKTCQLYTNSRAAIADTIYKLYLSQDYDCQLDMDNFLERVLSDLIVIAGYICDKEVLPKGTEKRLWKVRLSCKPNHYSIEWFEIAVAFILESLMDLRAILPRSVYLYQAGLSTKLHAKLCFVFETVCRRVYLEMEHKLGFDWTARKNHILDNVRLIRRTCLECFHAMVTKAHEEIMHCDRHLRKRVEPKYEDYLCLLNEAIRHKLFMLAYVHMYDFEAQVKMLNRMMLKITDPLRIHYLGECIKMLPKLEKQLSACPRYERREIRYAKRERPKNWRILPETLPTDEEWAAMIASVREHYPSYGQEFIKKCLIHYDYDASRVVERLHNRDLPLYLAACPHDLEKPIDEGTVTSLEEVKKWHKDAIKRLQAKETERCDRSAKQSILASLESDDVHAIKSDSKGTDSIRDNKVSPPELAQATRALPQTHHKSPKEVMELLQPPEGLLELKSHPPSLFKFFTAPAPLDVDTNDYFSEKLYDDGRKSGKGVGVRPPTFAASASNQPHQQSRSDSNQFDCERKEEKVRNSDVTDIN